MTAENWFIVTFGSLALALAIATVFLVEWTRDKGIETWGDLFTYRRRRRRMLAALADGAVKCTCRTGRRTVRANWRQYPPEMKPVDVVGWKSLPCTFCHGVGAYLPEPSCTKRKLLTHGQGLVGWTL